MIVIRPWTWQDSRSLLWLVAHKRSLCHIRLHGINKRLNIIKARVENSARSKMLSIFLLPSFDRLFKTKPLALIPTWIFEIGWKIIMTWRWQICISLFQMYFLCKTWSFSVIKRRNRYLFSSVIKLISGRFHRAHWKLSFFFRKRIICFTLWIIWRMICVNICIVLLNHYFLSFSKLIFNSFDFFQLLLIICLEVLLFIKLVEISLIYQKFLILFLILISTRRSSWRLARNTSSLWFQDVLPIHAENIKVSLFKRSFAICPDPYNIVIWFNRH